MNEVSIAIFCNCLVPNETNRYKVLGSITSEGYLEILRGHKNKTIIEVAECMIACRECGYKKYINLRNVVDNRPVYET